MYFLKNDYANEDNLDTVQQDVDKPAQLTSMQSILLLNGPNLNLLGSREPEIYGAATLAELEDMCRRWGADLALNVDCRQSNHEGELVELIHRAASGCSGIVINAGAFTHTSVALLDAVRAVALPTVEVHLSNIHAREPFRRQSYIAQAALGTIAGFGADSYRLALQALALHLSANGAP